MAARRPAKTARKTTAQSAALEPIEAVAVPASESEDAGAPALAAPGAGGIDDSDIRRQLNDASHVKFKLDIFEGPLDLLLYLIKINELDIGMVALREITGQYLDYIRMMETLDLEMAGDYLVVAATLINIKLRAILPVPEAEEGEEEETLDDLLSARQLMQQLIEYRNFKEAAFRLGARAESASRVFFREVALPKFAAAEADTHLQGDFESLIKAFQRVISFVERKNYHAVGSEEYSVDEKITMLRRRLFEQDRLDLVDLFRECRAKIEMIVLLLGVLELCKLHEVRILQGEGAETLYVAHRKDRPVPELPDDAAEKSTEPGANGAADADDDADDGKPRAEVIDLAAETRADDAGDGSDDDA